jgi:hypothetical protein
MYQIRRIVPLIGPRVAGPSGVLFLPRMWLKSVLSAAGLLYEGYTDYYRGFNQFVVDAIGLEPDPWFAFLKTMPTYPQTEEYVKANATKLDAASIAASNQRILTFERPEENAAPVREKAKIDAPDLRLSSMLIDYDDWYTVREQLLEHRAEGIEPIVPMVSSAQSGLLGIPHLPRLWMKAMFAAVHALPAEWKTCRNCGFDKRVAGMLGFDIGEAEDFIHAELPSYVEFEAWVRKHIPNADAATRAKWAAEIVALQKTDEMAVADLAEAGLPGLTVRSTILLNDLVDWRYMHDHAMGQRGVPA